MLVMGCLDNLSIPSSVREVRCLRSLYLQRGSALSCTAGHTAANSLSVPECELCMYIKEASYVVFFRKKMIFFRKKMMAMPVSRMRLHVQILLACAPTGNAHAASYPIGTLLSWDWTHPRKGGTD